MHTTSARRGVSPMSVHNGPLVTRLVEDIQRRDPITAPLILMPEPAAAGLEPMRVGPRASELGAILRGVPSLPAGASAWVCAAVGERWPGTDELVLERACAGYEGGRIERLTALIDAWIELLVRPALRLYSRYGIALELHTQNTLACVAEGRLHHIRVRDLGGIRIHAPRLNRHVSAPNFAADSFIVTDDLDEVRGKLEHSLFHAHLTTVFAAAGSLGLDERRCWANVRRVLIDCHAQWQAEPGLDADGRRDLAVDLEAFTRPRIRAKALLRMRLHERSSDYEYTPVDKRARQPARVGERALRRLHGPQNRPNLSQLRAASFLGPRPPRSPKLGLWCLMFALLVLAWPSAARAETWGQYLVVIDDSGSMDGTDPDRLAVLASLALAAGLGDADQVMLVGLNELANGERDGLMFRSPRELLADRDAAEGERALTGARIDRLALHGAGTPCKLALARAKDLLNSVAPSGAPQTLLMLTDGACGQPTIEPAATWLAGLTSHTEGRFRFVLLTKTSGGERVDANLAEYARATGWTDDPNISFDSRSLLRAFAAVLSFSRGLRYDDGGRIGLERSFAGVSEVRVLAVSTDGHAPISLARVLDGEPEQALAGGPTFKHSSYGWSLRVAKSGASSQPFSVRSPDPGVEVLVIPSYGALAIEAIVGPCEGERPPLPWTRERAVRSGQPACAWARLIGDRGETIHPRDSFAFELSLCEDAACTTASAMQPDQDGSFNAQLGVMPEGRSERWFRASGGSLAQAITVQRGVSAVAFGITSVARADAPDKPIDSLDLGVLPQALPSIVTLEFSGSFPDGGEADVRCEIAGDVGENDPMSGALACLRCAATPSTIGLQDPFTVQLEVAATSLCPLLSDVLRRDSLAVALDLVVEPKGAATKVGPRRVPIRATLRHAVIEAQTAEVTGGEQSEASAKFPGPVNAALELELVPGAEVPDGLEVALAQTELRLTGEPGSVAEVGITLAAEDCCAAGSYPFVLHVRDAAGGPSLEIPLTVTVAKPSFWVCPGKRIAKWTAVAAALGFLFWLIRGFTSPAKFGDTAVLVRAESHDALSKIGEGDEDWRLIRSLEGTTRGFYAPGTIHLGGSKAALPSLRELPADARIEARGHGSAALVVAAEGVEIFKESSGWQSVPVGELPIVGSSIVLRRDNTYLMFRR